VVFAAAVFFAITVLLVVFLAELLAVF